MKKTLLISLLSFAAVVSYAQDNAGQAAFRGQPVCRKYAEMPKGAVAVFPTCISRYIPVGDAKCAPCYEYTSKHGLTVMECPGLWFLPENGAVPVGQNVVNGDQQALQTPGVLNVQSENTYAGNYPKACKRDPNMPKGAVPTWPSSPYVSTQGDPACAPCYEYTTKHGLTVMECPFLYFVPTANGK